MDFVKSRQGPIFLFDVVECFFSLPNCSSSFLGRSRLYVKSPSNIFPGAERSALPKYLVKNAAPFLSVMLEYISFRDREVLS